MTKSIVEEDIVKRIEDADPAKPARVLFRGHAAFYYVYRDDPNYADFLTKLHDSQSRNVPIRFAYDYRGQRLTSVELVKP